ERIGCVPHRLYHLLVSGPLAANVTIYTFSNVSISSFTVTQPSTAIASINGSYSTNFPLTEAPINENGAWNNGATTGLDWGDCLTSSGQVHGSGPLNVNAQLYADPTAILTETWASNQMAQATLHINGDLGTTTGKEIELRLRSVVTPHLCRGYEFCIGIVPTTTYLAIIRWNGALNDFSGVTQAWRGNAFNDGDVFQATAVGNVLTLYLNGVQILQGTDSTWTNGNPGVGFWNNTPGEVSTYWPRWGWSNFSASNL